MAAAALGLAALVAAGDGWGLRPADRGAASAGARLDGPPDDAWCGRVAALPSDRQAAAVAAKLAELNPGFDSGSVGFARGRVSEVQFLTDSVSDVRPVRALASLSKLRCCGSDPGRGRLTDLGPLACLPLQELRVWNNPGLADLGPLRGMALTNFQAGDTAVERLDPLAGMPLGILAVNGARVRDLGPVRTLPKLWLFRRDGCPVKSTRPLAGTPVTDLVFDYVPARDAAVLRRMPALQRVNRQPLADLWRSDARGDR
jgi:hypothetical protein